MGQRRPLSAGCRYRHCLRRIAQNRRKYLQKERADHTLQPTALIHEAYVRLIHEQGAGFENRKKFFAFAAWPMRQILVDHARAVGAERRLESLARISPRKAQVIELRYFGGLSLEETAEMLETSAATVSRQQRMGEAGSAAPWSRPADNSRAS